MRLDPSRRAVLLLLACLVTAVVFPRACAETRVGAGELLPATAGLTSESGPDASADWTEAWVRQILQVERLREEMAARPRLLPPELVDVRIEDASRDVVRAVPGRLLHRDVGSVRKSFVIDVGSERGIYRGLAVAYGDTLVGVVRVAGDGGSRVLRVDDPARDNVYPASIVRAADLAAAEMGQPLPETPPGTERPPRAHGVCRGAGDGTLVVGHLAEHDAAAGDFAVTGAGRLGVPAGLVLGKVARVHDDDRDGVYEAVVEPLRDLDTIAAVIVYVRPPIDPALRPGGVK